MLWILLVIEFKLKAENIQHNNIQPMYNGFSTKIMFWIHTITNQKGENKICLQKRFLQKLYNYLLYEHPNNKITITFLMFESIQNSTCHGSS